MTVWRAARKNLPDTPAIYVVMAGDTASMPSKGKT